MDVNTFNDLLAPAGQEALAAAEGLEPKEADFLRHFKSLSRTFPRETARAALEIAILRRRAGAKFNLFPPGDRLYLTREALEQASAAEVSEYRAYRYRSFDLAADVGCSVGGDTMALAKHTCTIGIDNDELRLRMAVENVRAAGVEENTHFVTADVTDPLPLTPDCDAAIFFDPGRRENEKRAKTVEHYHPPLGVIHNWLADFTDAGVKISPAVRLEELGEYEDRYGAELEFISLRGELKDAVLWFGGVRTLKEPPDRGRCRRATLLPGPFTMTADTHKKNGKPEKPAQIKPPGDYVYEPDPAVLRAGLVTTLARRLDAYQLDRDIALLTANALVDTPFTRSRPIEDWMPFGLKRLRSYLRERGVGKITVKKRGSPIEPEQFKRDLRLRGEIEKLLILTHLEGKPIVIVCPV